MTVRENLDVGAHNPRAYPHRAETLKERFTGSCPGWRNGKNSRPSP